MATRIVDVTIHAEEALDSAMSEMLRMYFVLNGLLPGSCALCAKPEPQFYTWSRAYEISA
jgi:hypothetical protein